METQKLSEVSLVADVSGTERFPILKGGLNWVMEVQQIVNFIGNATTALRGLMSAADKSKLNGIQAGATANAADADLRDRETHTGIQSADTIGGLADVAISGDYDDLTGKPIDANLMHIPTAAFQSATGTTQGTAGPITKAMFHVSNADASNNGIILLEDMEEGATFTIFNGTGTGLSVYPPAGGQINYAGANVPYALGAYTPLRLILIDPANGVYQQI